MVLGREMVEFVAGLEPVEKMEGAAVVVVETREMVSVLSSEAVDSVASVDMEAEGIKM